MYSKVRIMEYMQKIIDSEDEYNAYVLIAMPLRDNTPPAQNVIEQAYMSVDFQGFSTGYIDIIGETIDVARNYLMEYALTSGAKYLLFMGEDTIMPFDGFLRLHETAEANPGSVVSGVYYAKYSSPIVRVLVDKWIVPADVTPGKIIKAHDSGMDAMLIPIDVLRKLKELEPELPFCAIYNAPNIEYGGTYMIGEDYYFCHRLRDAGIDLLVNTDVQMFCYMELATGKYTAHPDVDLRNYQTRIPIADRLVLSDKDRLDKSWIDRYPPLPHLIDRVDF